MAQNLPSFLQEALGAGRGTLALLRGRQDAPQYFDFSLRGLIGSFIALLLAIGVSVFGPMVFGMASPSGAAASMTLLSALLFGVQIGAAYFVLAMLGRLDGFLPYLVADNWVNFFVSLVGALSIVLLGGSDIMLLVVGVVSLVIEVNIARRILTLAPMQVAMFIVAQIVAQLLGLLVLGGILLQAIGLPA